MYFTDDSLLPENMPLRVSPPRHMGRCGCRRITPEHAGQVGGTGPGGGGVLQRWRTVLHIHVRDPQTGHISKDFQEYDDLVGRLRKVVPKMILQIGGSIHSHRQATKCEMAIFRHPAYVGRARPNPTRLRSPSAPPSLT